MIVKNSLLSRDSIANGLVACFLVYFTYRTTFQLWENVQNENGYTFGDWLINYEDGGFKRRGLSGSFFIFLYDKFNINIKWSIFICQVLLSLVFVSSFFYLIRQKHVSLGLLLLILSPCTFLFFFLEPGVIGRKEIIIYAAYGYFLFRLSVLKGSIWKVYYPFLLIVPIGILAHELFFFYSIFFIVPLFTTDKTRYSVKDKILTISVFALISGLTVALLFFYGGEINQGESFKILEERGISSRLRGLGNFGILTWDDNFNKVNYFKINGYWKYLISWFLGFTCFYLFLIFGNLKKKEFVCLFLLTFLFSLPIYILAIDWGRWLNIQFILTLFFIVYALPKSQKLVLEKSRYLVFYLISGLLILFWRFELVDKGFFISEMYFSLF